MKRMSVLIATVIAGVTVGAVPASAYPPGDTTPTTAVAGGGGSLPATGSDSTPTVQMATGIIVVGLGLAAVGSFRRRRGAAS
jgi:LPXTG-motif cell wall-anchored protein